MNQPTLMKLVITFSVYYSYVNAALERNITLDIVDKEHSNLLAEANVKMIKIAGSKHKCMAVFSRTTFEIDDIIHELQSKEFCTFVIIKSLQHEADDKNTRIFSQDNEDLISEIDVFMIFFNDYKDILHDSLLKHLQRNFWNSQAYFMLLSMATTNIENIQAKRILSLYWEKLEILNIVLICLKTNKLRKKISLITYNPFLKEDAISVIDSSCNDDLIFYDKFAKVQNYPLTVVTYNIPPFAFSKMDKGGEWVSSGPMVEVIRSIVRHMNFVFVDHSSDVRMKISRHDPDVTLGMFFSTPRILKNMSYPFFFDRAAIIVPKALQMPAWMNLIHPFSFDSWMAYISMFVFLVLVSKVVSKFEIHASPGQFSVLEVVRGFLVGGSIYIQQCTPLRLILVSTLLFNLIMNNCYTGLITSYLTVPRYYPELKTVDDLEANSISIAMVVPLHFFENTVVFDYMSNSLTDFDLNDETTSKLLSNTVITNDFDSTVHNVMFHRNISVYSSLSMAHYKIKFDYNILSHSKLSVMELNILLPIVLLFRKNFPYKRKFKMYLCALKEAGIVDKLLLDKMVSNKDTATNELSKLSLSHLQGVFFVLLIGILLSTLIFILELVFKFAYFFFEYIYENFSIMTHLNRHKI
ncbi:uncharacterized protein LOC134535668 [Bacillus rossius redtenbacheri]|uniref:uncharacterized protein LOC134535668 n=1 Tax=Bacillus rossius redtenbacheri TaxID=93214 RepID=UPI002FDD5805